MSRKTLVWLLFFSIILNISTIATFSYYRWFQHDGSSHSKRYSSDEKRSNRRKSFDSKLAKDLNLSEEQSEQMRELRSKFFKGFKPLMSELHKERKEFTEILKQDSLDTLKVNEKIEAISKIQKQIHFYSMKNLLKHRSILNDEQWRKFKSMFARMMVGGDRRKSHRPDSRRLYEKGEPKPDSTEQDIHR